MSTERPEDRRSSGRRTLAAGLLLLAAVGGLLAWQSGYLSHVPASSDASRKSGSGQGAAVAVPVHTSLAARGDFPIYLNGLGNVQAWNTATVRSRVDGQVERIAFEEGKPVKAGDVLVELDARPFQAALDQATAKIAQDQANLASAMADLERTKSLVGPGYATKQLLDQQTAAVDQTKALIQADEAARENARVSLGYTTIRAPFSGRLGLRTIDVGNIVHAGDQNGIVTIAEIQPIAVLFTAPEDQVPAINRALKGGPLKLIALSPDGKTELAEGTLSVVNNGIDAGSGTIRLKGRFENADSALWPGLSVTTRLLVSTLHDVVLIPDAAVQRGPAGLYSYVIGPDQRAQKRDIKVAQMGNGVAVVEAGIEPGDEVVTSGHYRLEPGAKVVVEPGPGDRTAGRQPGPQTE